MDSKIETIANKSIKLGRYTASIELTTNGVWRTIFGSTVFLVSVLYVRFYDGQPITGFQVVVILLLSFILVGVWKNSITATVTVHKED